MFKTKSLEKIGLISTILLSFFSWIITYKLGLSTIYNDAMSHLDLSRLVIDNIQPGLTQLGGTWLPLTHVLALSLVWNDWAWHSGIAITVFSMIFFVLSVCAVYLTVKRVTASPGASFLSALFFATNLNILYLQSTPLLEPAYLGCFLLSIYFFTKWLLGDDPIFLSISGFFGFLSVLIRYDGWFVTPIQALLVMVVVLLVRRKPISEAIGSLLIFIMPSIFGMMLWMVWNVLIFGDPTYFFLGHYSAHAQQFEIEKRVGLITHRSIVKSLQAYGFAALDNVGYIVTALSAVLIVSGAIILTSSKVRMFVPPVPKSGLKILRVTFLPRTGAKKSMFSEIPSGE